MSIERNTRIQIYPDAQALATAAADLFVERAQEAQANRRWFHVALSGGSTPRTAYALLAQSPRCDALNWERVRIYWGDERAVPPSHPESNYGMVYETLLKHVPIPLHNVCRMRGEDDPFAAAHSYQAALRGFWHDTPRFDLVMLGMGTDGHVASLFPHTTAVDTPGAWVVANHVPKLNMWRLTMTAEIFNAAACVAFLVSGSNKASRLRTILNEEGDPQEEPARLIKPDRGELIWLVDTDAASQLQHEN